jgi:hypothetical protein
MLEQDFSRVCRKIGSGAKFRIGRNHTGRIKLKLYTGPFGLFVRRFDRSDADLQRLREVLGASKTARKYPSGPSINNPFRPPTFKT